MASQDNCSDFEFAKLIPNGPDAERALDLVWANDDLEHHHQSFIHVERRVPQGLSDSGTDLSASELGKTDEDKSFWGGYYSLSLKDPIDKPFSIGWRIGRGSSKHLHSPPRGVDLLLIGPGKNPHKVAAVHARIQIHPRTGVLMLLAVQEGRPIYYQAHDTREPIRIDAGNSYVLYQRINAFRLGNLQYTLVFSDIPKEHYSAFLTKRNAMMQACGLSAPHPSISPVWREEHTKRGPVILHGSLAYGTFGWVYPAVYATRGDPVAVKEQKAKNTAQIDAIYSEIDIGKRFNEQQGLLPILKAWCEHEQDRICESLPENVFTTSPLALSDFKRIPWDTEHAMMDILSLFRGPLLGLVNLHREGFMHRDVHLGNLFIMSLEPPRALLGDFGKTIRAVTHNDPRIGPIDTLAPEIDPNGHNHYDNKIDVWSFAFAMHRAIFQWYHLSYSSGRVTRQWHKEALHCIDMAVTRKRLTAGVSRLMHAMLEWDPSKRISAADALEHPFFQQDAPPSLPSASASASQSQLPPPHVSTTRLPASALETNPFPSEREPRPRPTLPPTPTAQPPASPFQSSLPPSRTARHSTDFHQPPPRPTRLQTTMGLPASAHQTDPHPSQPEQRPRPTLPPISTAQRPAPPFQPPLPPPRTTQHSTDFHQSPPRPTRLQPQSRLPPLPAAAAGPSRSPLPSRTSQPQPPSRPQPSTVRPTAPQIDHARRQSSSQNAPSYGDSSMTDDSSSQSGNGAAWLAFHREQWARRHQHEAAPSDPVLRWGGGGPSSSA
ncbi:MAG: hypothetical protein Q9224_004045, partial [Gallowayella concinna]